MPASVNTSKQTLPPPPPPVAGTNVKVLPNLTQYLDWDHEISFIIMILLYDTNRWEAPKSHDLELKMVADRTFKDRKRRS